MFSNFSDSTAFFVLTPNGMSKDIEYFCQINIFWNPTVVQLKKSPCIQLNFNEDLYLKMALVFEIMWPFHLCSVVRGQEKLTKILNFI